MIITDHIDGKQKGRGWNVDTSTLLRKAKRQYMLNCKVTRYCLLTMHGSTVMATIICSLKFYTWHCIVSTRSHNIPSVLFCLMFRFAEEIQIIHQAGQIWLLVNYGSVFSSFLAGEVFLKSATVYVTKFIDLCAPKQAWCILQSIS